jgi:hypothetical protein
MDATVPAGSTATFFSSRSTTKRTSPHERFASGSGRLGRTRRAKSVRTPPDQVGGAWRPGGSL